MFRSAASKVMWVGRATVFLVGLAVILALIFGALSVAAAHTGSAGLFHLGHNNVSSALTTLTGNVNGSAMQVRNNNVDANDTALTLSVQRGEAPMRVNSSEMVANLNADQVDGMHASDLPPRGYARVSTITPHFAPETSKGVLGIQRTSPGNVYCFDLSFTPDASIASANINNNATVGTAVGNGVPTECPDTHEDAAAVTYGANDPDSVRRNDVNFAIAFM